MTNCSQDIFQKNISTCLYVSFAREGGEEGGELHNLSSVRFTEFQSVPPNMVLFWHGALCLLRTPWAYGTFHTMGGTITMDLERYVP